MVKYTTRTHKSEERERVNRGGVNVKTGNKQNHKGSFKIDYGREKVHCKR